MLKLQLRVHFKKYFIDYIDYIGFNPNVPFLWLTGDRFAEKMMLFNTVKEELMKILKRLRFVEKIMISDNVKGMQMV